MAHVVTFHWLTSKERIIHTINAFKAAPPKDGATFATALKHSLEVSGKSLKFLFNDFRMYIMYSDNINSHYLN